MLKGILLAPIRFLNWLLTDTGRARPGWGETMGQVGQSLTSTHLPSRNAEEELRQRVDEVRRHQKAASEAQERSR